MDQQWSVNMQVCECCLNYLNFSKKEDYLELQGDYN